MCKKWQELHQRGKKPTLTLPYNPTLPCALAGIIVGLHGGGARMLEKHAAGFLVARFCLL